MLRRVGGVSLPEALVPWRMSVPFPFGLLEVYEHEVRLRMRPTLFTTPLRAGPDGIELVFPVGMIVRFGVGFRTLDRTEFYFWTFRFRRTLEVLDSLGYPVTNRPERPMRLRARRP